MITIYKMTHYGTSTKAVHAKVLPYDKGIAYIAKHTRTTIEKINEEIEKGVYIFNIRYGYSYLEIEF